MQIEDLDAHFAALSMATEQASAGGFDFTVIKGMTDADGKAYEVAIKRTGGTPWVPETGIHVRPHRVPMGQSSSGGSPLGGEWQYLSRQFTRPPTPKSYLAHVLTVLASP